MRNEDTRLRCSQIFYSILSDGIQQFLTFIGVEKISTERKVYVLFLTRYCIKTSGRKIEKARYGIVHFAIRTV